MLRLLKVTGESLTPEYKEGDFVLISKIPFFFAHPAQGDIIAFSQPGYGRMIKRVQQVNPDGSLFVTGSHPASIDSRVFGPVTRQRLLGKVIWHLHKS